MSIDRHLNGHGVQDGPLRPDYGDGWAELKCDQCGATWVGVIGDPCGFCQDARIDMQLQQRELDRRNGRLHVVPDPDVTDADEEHLPAEHDWAPVDLVAIAAAMRTGDYVQIAPTILEVEGAAPLLYPGRTNQLFGESGGGKTWVGLAAVAETVRAGLRALIVDYEDTPAGTAERLVLLGLTDDEIALVDYRNPTTGLMIGLSYVLERLEDQAYALVVLDSTGEAMASGSVNPNADEEVAMWFRRVREFTGLPGEPAVVVLDHIPKATDAPASYAIGSQRKRAAITGASYRVDTIREPARGKSGFLKLTVAKDRPGNRAKGTTAALVDVKASEDGSLELHFHVSEADAAKAAGARWRPTIYMERISRWLEVHPGSSKRTLLGDVQGKREVLEEALDVLAEEGWFSLSDGPRGAKLYRVDRPFRESGDVDNSDPDPPAHRGPTAARPAHLAGGDDPRTRAPSLQGECAGGYAGGASESVDNSHEPRTLALEGDPYL